MLRLGNWWLTLGSNKSDACDADFTGRFRRAARGWFRQKTCCWLTALGTGLGRSVCRGHSVLRAPRFCGQNLTPALGVVVIGNESCETDAFVTAQVWENQKVGLESPYLRYPCAQHSPGACGKKQGLVSVFYCNFSIYQWTQQRSIVITSAQIILPGREITFLSVITNKHKQWFVMKQLFSSKAWNVWNRPSFFNYQFWWYFHKVNKTTISSA